MTKPKTKSKTKPITTTSGDDWDFKTTAMRLEAAASAEGLTAMDVLRFPDICAKYKITDATQEDVAEANRLSRRLYEGLVRKHGLKTGTRPSTEGSAVSVSVSVSNSTEKTTMASYTINKKDLVALLISLGYKLAAKWPEKRLLETVRDKIGDHEDGEDCSDPALLKKLIKAVNKGVEIVLDADAPEDEPEAKPAKKGSKAKPAPEPEDEPESEDEPEGEDEPEEEDEDAEEEGEDEPEEEDEPEVKPSKKGASKAKPGAKKGASKAKPAAEPEDEEEDEVVSLKPKKGASKAKPGAKKGASKDSDKKPGVIATIFAIVQKATAAKPMSRDDVFAALVDAFPERDADALKSTVQTQLPSRIAKEKNVKIEKNEKGYWIVK